ncbi:hypothetical protein ASE68_12320 [Agromyces sp. Leaf222]|nr:hypothetical protein ASE68_12320 [Agromyces sp. Leaf222]
MSLRATRDTDLDTLNRITPGDDALIGTDAPSGTDADADRRTIRADGEIVGQVARWLDRGDAFVACRVDGTRRDDGIAGRALRLYLEVLDERPVRTRVAPDDDACIRVLERLGFEPDSGRPGGTTATGAPVDELVFLLA